MLAKQWLNNARDVMTRIEETQTEKYVLRGNARAKNLKTVAYINAVEKTSMIDVVSLPKLGEGEFVEVYAQIEDHFVSLGILDPSDKKMQTLPYMENALGLSLRIGSKKGSDENDKEPVAEIELKTKNN